MPKLIKVHILNTCSLLCQLNLNKTVKQKRRKTDVPAFSVLVRQPMPNNGELEGGGDAQRGPIALTPRQPCKPTRIHTHPQRTGCNDSRPRPPLLSPSIRRPPLLACPLAGGKLGGKRGHCRPWSKIPMELVHTSEIIWSSRCCDPLGEITLFASLVFAASADGSLHRIGPSCLPAVMDGLLGGGESSEPGLHCGKTPRNWGCTSQMVKGVIFPPLKTIAY